MNIHHCQSAWKMGRRFSANSRKWRAEIKSTEERASLFPSGFPFFYSFSVKNVMIKNSRNAINSKLPPTTNRIMTKVSFQLNGFKLYSHMPPISVKAPIIPSTLWIVIVCVPGTHTITAKKTLPKARNGQRQGLYCFLHLYRNAFRQHPHENQQCGN